ncbi:hypothetical protein [Thiomicrorhabdus sediminis]|uniref:Uncharacterized protein n=1 Tax=Thiomicrorhabdus sediminis TaxID=2580412 RepID=A0A4P9K7X5_9GAMM|nr:hypothetical protein [Thiomicrorhabdus sediminis]QCU90347.1 hypothetical protein FE785_06740 [Thiomicrorhabdus sediminis]
MLKYLTLLAVVVFFYWLIKHKWRQRQLAKQGIQVEQKGLRPITLLSLVMIVMYGGYLIYYLFSSNP